ncbi:MAG: glycoside hydrolase [Acidobacteria bacterium]|nr:glycoside hydrolase [Acidobacteriota bacterium]
MNRILPASVLIAAAAFGQTFDAKLFTELKWRSIGPYRAGRTRAATGVAQQPGTFYIGAVSGGVWKTTDYGRIWSPIFDDQPSGSVGAIAVAPSDPNTIYVGSGEGLQRPDLSTGDGVYRSNDAGRTWVHLGLRDGQQIPQIAVDPTDPKRIFVAVLGHPYGPNTERGVFRSLDAGATFQRVFFIDENTGASDVAIDPANPSAIYAGMWEARQGPWENGAFGTGGGIYKSTDGGDTWKPLTKGLPVLGQVNIAIAPSNPKRLYIAAASTAGRTVGLYRSDDGGESWIQTTNDPRPATRIGGGDCPVLRVDPKNPDLVYSASIVTWRSTDAGRTWTGIRGAPGGDDYQNAWIDPNNSNVILLASDQGAIVTVNGGETWSSWYNQPTAQMYHVAADNAFPYRLCGGQQESGSACVSSRGDGGQITFRDWSPVGVEEYGYVAPDPLDPDLVYGGKITRYDRRTGQVKSVAPKPLRNGGYRALRTAPVQFSPVDPRTLYFAANTLWKTRDGGKTWAEISPDLSRKTWEVPASVGKYKSSDAAKPVQRGVIYALAPSPLDINRLWAGTDDGLIHLTTDGGQHWKDVTPPQIGAWWKISILDAGHFEPGACYAAVNTFKLDDLRPHIFRTHDSGRTWTEIVNGIPAGAIVNVVREDPKRKGLLYAGTEREVYVSFDDGDHWQSLRNNMPATSIRDLIVKGDDLAVGTHSRGFWILDNVTPLRQIAASIAQSGAVLFAPQTATRVRWNMNTDTPLPPDEPAGQNPPDGAMIDYYLGANISGPVSVEILDSAGAVVRRYSSDDRVEPVDPNLAIPKYWVRPARALSNAPGLHRWLWDMKYTPLATVGQNYPMTAILHDTAPAALSMWVLPGKYTVRLTAGGKSYSQSITVRMDPRVKTSAADLAQQFAVSKQLYDDALAAARTIDEVRTARARQPGTDFDRKAQAIEGERGGFGRRGGPAASDTLGSVSGTLMALLNELQAADVAPTAAEVGAVNDRRAALKKLFDRWAELKQGK